MTRRSFSDALDNRPYATKGAPRGAPSLVSRIGDLDSDTCYRTVTLRSPGIRNMASEAQARKT